MKWLRGDANSEKHKKNSPPGPTRAAAELTRTTPRGAPLNQCVFRNCSTVSRLSNEFLSMVLQPLRTNTEEIDSVSSTDTLLSVFNARLWWGSWEYANPAFWLYVIKCIHVDYETIKIRNYHAYIIRINRHPQHIHKTNATSVPPHV